MNAALGYGLFRDCKDNLKRWAPELTANTEAKIARHANQYFSGRLLMAGRGAGTLLLMTAYFQHIVHIKHESSTTTTQVKDTIEKLPKYYAQYERELNKEFGSDYRMHPPF